MVTTPTQAQIEAVLRDAKEKLQIEGQLAMDDLVQRLRNSDDLNDQQITFACTEAADEIERLRRENEMLRREFDVVREVTAAAEGGNWERSADGKETIRESRQALEAEIERLRVQVIERDSAIAGWIKRTAARAATIERCAQVADKLAEDRSRCHRERNEIIERCAQVAESTPCLGYGKEPGEVIAEAVRSFKE